MKMDTTKMDFLAPTRSKEKLERISQEDEENKAKMNQFIEKNIAMLNDLNINTNDLINNNSSSTSLNN